MMANLTENDMSAKKQLRIVGIIFGVVIVLLAVAYFLFLRLNYAILYQGLPTADASAIVAELNAREIRYKLRNGGRDILVPAVDADAIRLGILDAEAPTKKLDGFELFNDSEMGLTDFAQKIKFQRALQGELARTIMMIDGIENARVHIAIPERVLFRGSETPPTAAVTIVSRSGSFDEQTRIEGIQRLVAAAVPDLEIENVSVLNSAGEIISPVKTPISSVLSEYAEIAAAYKDQIDIGLAIDRPALNYTLKVAVRPFRVLVDTDIKETTAPKRDYVLRVVLTTDEVLDDDAKSEISSIIYQAAQMDLTFGDTLTFKVRELPLNLSLASAMQSTVSPPSLPSRSGPLDTPSDGDQSLVKPLQLPLLAFFTVLLLGLSGLGAFFISRQHRSLLNTEEHIEFAKRLRLQMHEGEGSD
ncbi:flagellar basal-body MS-ring/collar protein FliF [Fretibacter rubidus]|uniref:flagellar basal-body MS-ring/collar protein FliF n=1 Tax=Fretibacter rubidus TaxID=570162 RepID=UPI00352AC0C7